MTEHERLCRRSLWAREAWEDVPCDCKLIAKVRADEQAGLSAWVEAKLTNWGWDSDRIKAVLLALLDDRDGAR